MLVMWLCACVKYIAKDRHVLREGLPARRVGAGVSELGCAQPVGRGCLPCERRCEGWRRDERRRGDERRGEPATGGGEMGSEMAGGGAPGAARRRAATCAARSGVVTSGDVTSGDSASRVEARDSQTCRMARLVGRTEGGGSVPCIYIPIHTCMHGRVLRQVGAALSLG